MENPQPQSEDEHGGPPLVSIAIPTFRRVHYLRQSVESALAQTWGKIEVLVGDDGDTTEIPDWCRRRSASDRRLKYIRNESRLGLSGNWSSLALTATGKYITFMGDDDLLLPEFVERMMAAVGVNTAVAFCNHYVINETGQRDDLVTRRSAIAYGRSQLTEGAVENARAVAWGKSICPSAALLRRAEVLRLGFKKELNSPDTEYFIRLAETGAEFRFCEDYLVEFRIHPSSAMATGLYNDLLAEALIQIPVAADDERLKRSCVVPMMVNAVGCALKRGDHGLARRLMESAYYPSEASRFLVWVQTLCARLPASIGGALYRLMLFAKARLGIFAPGSS